MNRSLIFTILFPCFLVSCGFQPVYKTQNSDILPSIKINPIDSLDGAELYHHLSNLIKTSDDGQYQLNVKLEYLSSPLAITKDSNIVQQSATQLVSYDLIDQSTHRQITSGNFRLTGSYNAMFSAYESHTEEQQTKANLAGRAAEEIRLRLIMYFYKK
jgi:hypothetical protein